MKDLRARTGGSAIGTNEEENKTVSQRTVTDHFKAFFRISKDENKSPFQYICMIAAIMALFICMFKYNAWDQNAVETREMQMIAFFAFIAVGTYIGGRPTAILILALFYFCFYSFFSYTGKRPGEKSVTLEAPKQTRFAETGVNRIMIHEKIKLLFVAYPGDKVYYRSDKTIMIAGEDDDWGYYNQSKKGRWMEFTILSAKSGGEKVFAKSLPGDGSFAIEFRIKSG